MICRCCICLITAYCIGSIVYGSFRNRVSWIFIIIVISYPLEILYSRFAVLVQKVDMVQVEALVNDSAHNSLTRISLRQTHTFVNLIHASVESGILQLLLNGTFKLNPLDALGSSYALGVIQWHCNKGKATATANHVHSLGLKVFFSHSGLQLSNCQSVGRINAKHFLGFSRCVFLIRENIGFPLLASQFP